MPEIYSGIYQVVKVFRLEKEQGYGVIPYSKLFIIRSPFFNLRSIIIVPTPARSANDQHAL